MDVIYFLLPLALLLGLIDLALLAWSVKSGQLDDLEGPAHRILFDDDEEPLQHPPSATSAPDTPPAPKPDSASDENSPPPPPPAP
ncbi:MAG: cbb3-type cytochrome oxidase assembly protein CcoS [Magnetococcales bacterium]|nr:cbb3-type cytochrome oxidase assembly protein CcoS [Magnetococcales bacterium]